MNRRHWLTTELSIGLSAALGVTSVAKATTSVTGREREASTVSEEQIDAQRLARKVPIKVRWPPASFGPNRPLVIFSHGLGGSMNGGDQYGEAWAQAGMVVVHIQHLGSDAAALRSSPRSAMAPEQLLNRVEDVKAVLDYAEQFSPSKNFGNNTIAAHGATSWSRIDTNKIGVSGHSFGSRTTLAIAGEVFPNAPSNLNLSDARPKAFIALSPFSSGGDLEAMRRNLRGVVRPILTLTGSEDGDVANVGTTPAQRAAVFDALTRGNKAGLILKHADHFTFAGQDLPAVLGRRQRPEAVMAHQKEHLAQLCQLSTDWWLSQLSQDAAATQRLVAPKIREDRGDVWLRG
jgi:predicted dienelactone hydrolase